MSVKELQEYTYYSRYARYNKQEKRRETWGEAVDRVMDMHLRKYPMVAEEIEWIRPLMKEKRTLGSQRALQFGGTPVERKNARLYNCFEENTEFVTKQGVKKFSDFQEGETIEVLTHLGNWKKAIVKSYGKQDLHPIKITRNSATHTVWATKNHRWLLKNGDDTTNLHCGDHLLEAPDVLSEFDYDTATPDERLYWAYGMVYGDGTCIQGQDGTPTYSLVRLCGRDKQYTYRFEELGFKTSTNLSIQGDYFAYTGTYKKTPPDPNKDEPRLIRAFVRGYLDADGARNRNARETSKDPARNLFNSIQSSEKSHIEFIRNCFPIAGLYIVSEKDLTGQETNYGIRPYTISFRIFNNLGKTAAHFRVANEFEKEISKHKTAWCLEVEDDHSFVLPFGLSTGNCSAAYCDRIRFFQESLWMLLCGSGVGFSVQKHHIAQLPPFHPDSHCDTQSRTYVIPDSIEGWSDALGILMASYFEHHEFPEWLEVDVKFDFSKIRPAGSYLSSGVGKAPGPAPLKKALNQIKKLLERCVSQEQERLRPIDAYDIIMHASDAVLSGGVRRSATLCLFSPDDEEMLTAKTGNWFYDNPQRARSNNSALLLRNETSKEDFLKLMQYVREFGEPGFIWADDLEALFNPCVEIGLYARDVETNESGWQVCNLCEINGKKIKCKEDFALAVRAAAILGTLQAGYTSFDYLGEVSERIIKKEALLGVSMTGMMDSPDILFDPEIQKEMSRLVLKTNEWVAKKIGINLAARACCVKPAGCQKKETLLVTKKGIFSLEEMGDINSEQWQECSNEVMSGPNAYAKSSKFYVNGFGNTKKIIMQSGIEIECTLNHKFKIFKDGSLEWAMAKDIILGDHMPYVVGGYSGGNAQPLKQITKQHFNATPLKHPTYIDEDLAWVLGLYIGDGSNHIRGIRIHGDKNKPNVLEKAKRIILSTFGLKGSLVDENTIDNRLTLVINSVDLLRWLKINNLKKNKSPYILFPKIIRMSPANIIENYINGYWCADGGLHPINKTRSWVTTSFQMAQQLVVVLRALGQDASVREMPPTNSSWGKRMRYWVQERKGRKGNYMKSPWAAAYRDLDARELKNYTPDFVKSIEDSENHTFDIEIPSNHMYCANSYISHNTTSCILGSSSGIHPHHAKRYFRRVQGNETEVVLQHFKEYNPTAVQPSVWSANNTDEVITFCIEVPDGSKTKNQVPALELLEHVKLTQQNWVGTGRRKKLCAQPWLTHNVSNTINIRPDEWDNVAEYIFKNKKWFAGISLIPQSGDLDYPQAPMVTVRTPREILQMYGDGSLFASGLIVDGLHAFKNNLWEACDSALGLGEPLEEPIRPGNGTINLEDHRQWEIDCEIWQGKIDWIRRIEQFAKRYCDDNVRRCTYLLKDTNNWKLWLDLNREYKKVDYTILIEETDETVVMDTIACSGGACEVI